MDSKCVKPFIKIHVCQVTARGCLHDTAVKLIDSFVQSRTIAKINQMSVTIKHRCQRNALPIGS